MEGGKPAWRDRGKPEGSGAPGQKPWKTRPAAAGGSGKKPWDPKPSGAHVSPQADKPRSAQRYHGANQPGGKPPSKYALKKKQRPPAAG